MAHAVSDFLAQALRTFCHAKHCCTWEKTQRSAMVLLDFSSWDEMSSSGCNRHSCANFLQLVADFLNTELSVRPHEHGVWAYNPLKEPCRCFAAGAAVDSGLDIRPLAGPGCAGTDECHAAWPGPSCRRACRCRNRVYSGPFALPATGCALKLAHGAARVLVSAGHL